MKGTPVRRHSKENSREVGKNLSREQHDKVETAEYTLPKKQYGEDGEAVVRLKTREGGEKASMMPSTRSHQQISMVHVGSRLGKK